MPAAVKVATGPRPETLRALARDDSARAEAAQKWTKTVDETNSLDVLERCKKLNEFLSSDFLKNGGKNKQDLQQILDILGQGPKRPACLEKAPVTSTSGTSSGASSKRTSLADSAAGKRPLSGYDADKLLSLLGDDELSRSSTTASNTSVTTAPSSIALSTSSNGPSDDLDDLIGLLNPASSPAMPSAAAAAREQAEKAAKEAAQNSEADARKASDAEAAADKAAADKAAAEAARQKAAAAEKAKADAEAAERRVKEQRGKVEREKQRQQEEAEAAAARARQQKAAAEAAEKLRQRQAAAAAAAESARQAKRGSAAVSIQRFWRGFAARAALQRARQAATVLQSAERARAARTALVQARAVQAMRRRHAAARIQRIWRAWIAGGRGWNLGPLRVRSGSGRPPSGSTQGVGVLGPVRMRSAADARLAQTAADAVASVDDAAAHHRVVVATKARGSEVGEAEARKRAELGARAVMAGSDHRDTAAAVAVARAASLPRAPAAGSR